jgi:hypothetical protein
MVLLTWEAGDVRRLGMLEELCSQSESMIVLPTADLGSSGVDPVWWTPKMRVLPSRWESDATTTPVLPAGVQG